MESTLLSHILIDLDNTVYPSSSGLLDEMDRRMTLYMANLLKVPYEEAVHIRQDYRMRYGATLTALISMQKVKDPEDFLAFTHPKNLESFLSEDRELADRLDEISLPLSILTNSPLEHAERVLKLLGIRRCFHNIFDLRFNHMQGKPSLSVYKNVLHELGMSPQQVLFIDDHIDYLLPFRGLGGRVLLVQENGDLSDEDGIPRIRRLVELRDFLQKRCTVSTLE